MTSRILFTDKDHSWTVPKISFDYSGVTIPIPQSRVIFSSPHEWSWLTVNDILERTKDYGYGDKRQNSKFYEIVECMQSMETLYNLFHMYVMGGSHIGNHKINLTNEVKAIKTLKTWIKYANQLHKLIGVKEKILLTDKLIIKVARETKPTIFKMPNNERCYDDKKSVITFLSPYEDNTKALEEKQKSKNCIIGKNKINKFLKSELQPFKVGY